MLKKIAKALRGMFGRDRARNAVVLVAHFTFRPLRRRLPELEESLPKSAWEVAERRVASLGV